MLAAIPSALAVCVELRPNNLATAAVAPKTPKIPLALKPRAVVRTA